MIDALLPIEAGRFACIASSKQQRADLRERAARAVLEWMALEVATMSYSPAIVANAVLTRANQRGIFISHLKLQKLVFFTHAWCLAILGEPAVDERPEAWEFGPVFNTLYYRLKERGHERIRGLIESVDASTNAFATLVPSPDDIDFWSILDQVMSRYGAFTAVQLSTLSHEPGGPWEQARLAGQAVIQDEAVRRFYEGKLQ